MPIQQTDILIIGAGLTGLALAYLLRDSGRMVTLLEARDRIGGRIHTDYVDGSAPLELGATWLGRKHTALWGLLDTLGLDVHAQRGTERAIYEPDPDSPHQLVDLPANDAPSYRISGGSQALIAALAGHLSPEQVRLGTTVRTLSATAAGLEVTTTTGTYTAARVVSTLPPYLFGRSVITAPALPPELTAVTDRTHTWMGDSIKVGLRYPTPFWREAGSSGTVFSQAGPVTELYDHAATDDGSYALKGFIDPHWARRSAGERRTAVIAQLVRYYGARAAGYTDYREAVWAEEPLTYRPYSDYVAPHQHGGHPHYHRAYLDGRLYLAGTETAAQYPGYMEGAVRSAQWVKERLVATRSSLAYGIH